jgi:4'-phosphopantetheinyl transferase
MPLVLQRKINTSCQVMVWEIKESREFFQENLGKNNWQILEFEQISHPTKQLEWLASRFLAKLLAEKMNLSYRGLVKDANSKPFLQDLDHHLSISHTVSHVAAAIHFNKPIGIDLEKISERLHMIKHKFLTENERTNANDSLEMLCIYWSAKESLYKLYGQRGVHFQKELIVENFDRKELAFKGKILTNGFDYTADIQAIKINDSYLTIAF